MNSYVEFPIPVKLEPSVPPPPKYNIRNIVKIREGEAVWCIDILRNVIFPNTPLILLRSKYEVISEDEFWKLFSDATAQLKTSCMDKIKA